MNHPEALRQRYGSATPTTPPAWTTTLDLLLGHRSVRTYRDAPLPEGTLEAMLAAAQSAATSSNLQTWSVLTVDDPERRERLARWAGNQAHVRTAPLFLVWLADLSRLERVAHARDLPYAGLDYTEMFVMAVVDVALAAQNAVVAAEALGLGTNYLGALRNHPLEVAAELNLPPRSFAVFGLCVGWPDPDQPAAVKPRLPQAAVLHREQYQPAHEPDAVAEYNATMAAFYAEQQMRVTGDWAQHSAQRVAGPQSLSGRDVLRAALEQLGFALR